MDCWHIIRGVAGRQGGVITRQQALQAGFTRHEIDNFVAFGRWRRLARARYLVEGSPTAVAERPGRIRAAVLSLGPHAHAVLATAAELHRIEGLGRTAAIHVALPGRAARPARLSDPAVVLHQFDHAADAVTVVDGVPSTTAV